MKPAPKQKITHWESKELSLREIIINDSWQSYKFEGGDSLWCEISINGDNEIQMRGVSSPSFHEVTKGQVFTGVVGTKLSSETYTLKLNFDLSEDE